MTHGQDVQIVAVNTNFNETPEGTERLLAAGTG